jgi:hypothetical protein
MEKPDEDFEDRVNKVGRIASAILVQITTLIAGIAFLIAFIRLLLK